MTILLKPRDSGPSLTYIFGIATYVLSAVFFLGFLYFRTQNILYVLIAAVIGALVLYLLMDTWPPTPPVVIINEHGILDHRLGVGVIRWNDIIDAQIEVQGPFLCLRVKNPEFYIARLGPVRKQNMLFHQSLGFRMLNIEARGLEVNLLNLLEIVRKRIGPTKSQL